MRRAALLAAASILGALACSEPAAPPELLGAEAAPPDFTMVASAISLELRGAPHPEVTPRVRFVEGLAETLREPEFRFEGFQLGQIVASKHELREGDPHRVRAAGALYFLDGLGRRAIVAFEAEYETRDEEVLVTRAGIANIYPTRPEVRLYFVPAATTRARDLEAVWNHTRAYDYALEHAVDPRVPEEVPGGEHEYWVFAFVVDRVAPDAFVDLRLSSVRDGLEGIRPDPVVVDQQGYRLAITKIRADLRSDRERFLKIIYLAGDHVPGRQRNPILAGLYSTRLISP